MTKHRWDGKKNSFRDILITTLEESDFNLAPLLLLVPKSSFLLGWKSLIDVNVKTLTGGSLLEAARRIFAAKLEANELCPREGNTNSSRVNYARSICTRVLHSSTFLLASKIVPLRWLWSTKAAGSRPLERLHAAFYVHRYVLRMVYPLINSNGEYTTSGMNQAKKNEIVPFAKLFLIYKLQLFYKFSINCNYFPRFDSFSLSL